MSANSGAKSDRRAMDSIRVAKVSGVVCTKPGVAASTGSLHLTAHHLIYNADADDQPLTEMWVGYPLISLVTRLPQTLRGLTPLSFRTRTFDTFTLSFATEQDAADVFDSVKELTVAPSVTQLYAFYYQPSPLLPTNSGWSLYSPRDEFTRMGVGSRTKAWRFTDINKDFSLCPTYPARLVVPTKISDTTLSYASKYRSKCRIPTLAYLHWANYGTITRSSQPMVGLTNNRSVQDEKLIQAIFQSHHTPSSPYSDTKVYGATATNLIIDARPTTNAMANVARGAGTENMDHYKDGKKAYLGVDNIHVMRDSLAKVVDALRDAELTAAAIDPALDTTNFLDRQALRRSGWLRHISALLEGTVLIIRNVHVNSSHVLIHCSDGWDRTAQLSSLAQLCLDPYYRTIRGFQILIEKDWLAFGHRFLDRCGHLSSDKFFLTAPAAPGGGDADAAQAFIASVQNRFAGQHHLKETSPVFHQFLECVRQIQRQFPARFEFNARFLAQLHHHLYACQFGTFLFNNEQERRAGGAHARTVSAWDWFGTPEELEKNTNKEYDPALDDAKGADMGVLFPSPRDVRFWHELYGRTDEEMNGRVLVAAAAAAEEDSALVPGTPRSPSTPPAEMPLPPSSNGVGAPSVAVAASKSAPSLSLQDRAVDAPETEEPPSAGPSSLRRKTGPAVKLPEAFTGGGIRSMWGKLSSNASAALMAVQDAYEGVAKEYGAGAGQSGEMQAVRSDEEGDAEERPSRRLAALDIDAGGGNPWAAAAQRTPPRADSWAASSSSSSSPASAAPPVIGLPPDPSVAHPPSHGASSSAGVRALPFATLPRTLGSSALPWTPPAALPRTPSSVLQRTASSVMPRSPPSPTTPFTSAAPPSAPTEIPLPRSRSPSVKGSSDAAAVTERLPPPGPGQQSDPLGVGWL